MSRAGKPGVWHIANSQFVAPFQRVRSHGRLEGKREGRAGAQGSRARREVFPRRQRLGLQAVDAVRGQAGAGPPRHAADPDLYAVLDLNPGGGVTHDDIKKQHRRLCLLVHPDKNPCAAADGAFMLVQAASHALLAKHPPLGTSTAVPAPANQPSPPQQRQQAAPPRPPEPQTRPRPRRRPAPQTTPRPAAPKPPTNSQQETPKQEGKCSACGAQSFNRRNNYRCMSCLWSPMDGRREPNEDDYDDRHEPHEDDDYDDDFFDY